VDLTWADLVQTLVGGLAAVLGVSATQEMLRLGRCPERWKRSRMFLLPRGRRRDGRG
jgi:uncharacterized membrane protein